MSGRRDSWGGRVDVGEQVRTIDEDLEDFSSTIAPGLEATINQMVRFKEHKQGSRTVDYSNLELQTIQNLTNEVKELREKLSKVVTALNLKSSVKRQDRFEAALTEKIDKRLDNIRLWIAGIGSVIGVGMAIVGLLKH